MKLTPLEPWIIDKIGVSQPALDGQALQAYQLDRLRQTIQVARQNSRFYAPRLADAPADIASLDELKRLPFTTPDDLRKNGPQMVCVSQSEIERIVTLDTSGTTGSPKRVYFTLADQELTIDFFQHGMSTFTGSGDRVLILLPYERPGSVGDLLATGLRRLGAIPAGYGPLGDPRGAIEKLLAEGADVIVGAPSNVLLLARFWEARRLPRQAGPKAVLLSTDHVPQAIVVALESAWDCQVYNHYGMTEMGLGGGVECQARSGYHLREADLFFEIVDPRNGQPLPEGQSGEVVFTTLTRGGMPLIRYRTGDLSRFIPGQCACGASLRRLEKVTRRLNGQATLAAARGEKAANPGLSMADLDEALFALPQVLNFSASLDRRDDLPGGPKDLLEVQLISLPGAVSELANRAIQALETIPAIQAARQAGALDLHIRLQAFNAAQAGSLAKRRIIDLRGG